MNFISTNSSSEPATFSEAVLGGLAPDGGLYVPEQWPPLPERFWSELAGKSLPEIGLEISVRFIDEIGPAELNTLLEDALNFDAPLVRLSGNRYILELFHGPTLAFKDFGARFMSRIFSRLQDPAEGEIVILTATSGDTGSAVAQGFHGVEGIKVCLLYPSGKVSRLQEQQLTTAGENVTALEVEGTFDDCQQLVKQAFSDSRLNERLTLSSANSINIARLLPQTFYYVYGLAQLRDVERQDPIFCVPSGNFGNLTAGLIARKLGMPARGFIAATNINDVVPEYLETGEYYPRPSRQTISNAMDVGDPSNFARIEYLHEGSHEEIRNHLWGASFTDEETRSAIHEIYQESGYLMDPHTAVGYLALRKYRETAGGYFGDGDTTPYVVLATAHPAKFRDVIEPVIGEEIPLPDRLRESMEKEKQSVRMQNNYDKLKDWLITRYG